MKKNDWYEEEFYFDKYEVSQNRITRIDYDFRRFRECTIYEEECCWMEESRELYCNIRAVRIA